MPYVVFLTIQENLDITKARAQYTDKRGETSHVFTVEEPQWIKPEEALHKLVAAIADHRLAMIASNSPPKPRETA